MTAIHLPRTIGVIHLRALPGSPGFEGDIATVASQAARDAETLADAGFDGIIVENFGDAPFEPGPVPSVTVAAMTRCALAARVAAPTLMLGINVLRNDAEAALGVAIATGASFVRINVHIGARLTDQGIVEGRAARTLRLRQALGARHVALLCDVDVKHSASMAPRSLREETEELVQRGGADGVLVTGSGTGKGVAFGDLNEVLAATSAPVFVASGATEASLPSLRRAYGVIVGTSLRADGKPGGRIDPAIARRFVAAFAESRSDARSDGRTDPPGPVRAADTRHVEVRPVETRPAEVWPPAALETPSDPPPMRPTDAWGQAPDEGRRVLHVEARGEEGEDPDVTVIP